jgi:hypothetical protein
VVIVMVDPNMTPQSNLNLIHSAIWWGGGAIPLQLQLYFVCIRYSVYSRHSTYRCLPRVDMIEFTFPRYIPMHTVR